MLDLNEDARKFVERMEKEMKRGFINILVLYMLKNGHSHGYKIIKNIENHTIWHASASSIYPILKKLTEKDFINYDEESDGERNRKVYFLTKKGEKVLEILDEKHREMRSSIDSIIKSRLIGKSKDKFPIPSPSFIISHFDNIIKESDLDDLHKIETKVGHSIEKLKQVHDKIIKKIKKIIETKKKILRIKKN